MDPEHEALEHALTCWAEEQRRTAERRDPLIRAAVAAGISKHRVHVLTGVARTTIDNVLAGEPVPGQPRSHAAI